MIPMNARIASTEDIHRLFRGLSDHTVLKMLESGATLDQLEEVLLWISQENDVMGEARRPIGGALARLLELLELDEGYLDYPDEERG